MSHQESNNGLRHRIEHVRLIGLATREASAAIQPLLSMCAQRARFYVDHCCSESLQKVRPTPGDLSKVRTPGSYPSQMFRAPGSPDLGAYTSTRGQWMESEGDVFCGFDAPAPMNKRLDHVARSLKHSRLIPADFDHSVIWVPSPARIEASIKLHSAMIAQELTNQFLRELETCDEILSKLNDFDRGLLY